MMHQILRHACVLARPWEVGKCNLQDSILACYSFKCFRSAEPHRERDSCHKMLSQSCILGTDRCVTYGLGARLFCGQ